MCSDPLLKWRRILTRPFPAAVDLRDEDLSFLVGFLALWATEMTKDLERGGVTDRARAVRGQKESRPQIGED